MSDTQSTRPMLTSRASDLAVAHNAAAMFNRVIQPGDLVAIRNPDGSKIAGSKLSGQAVVNDFGQVVCFLDGQSEQIDSGRISKLFDQSSPPSKIEQPSPPQKKKRPEPLPVTKSARALF